MKFTYLNIAKSAQNFQLLSTGEMQAISQTYRHGFNR